MPKNNTSNNIGKKLKELRLAHNYTQSEVAMAADIKQQSYSAYESGKRIPGAIPLYKIASYYGIPADDLLKLCITLDDDVYFDKLPMSERGIESTDYLVFCNDPRYSGLKAAQKEILYYFSKLDSIEQKDIIDYAEFKLIRRKNPANEQ